MSTLYPAGYGSEMVTLDELDRRFGTKMHPEYRRRLFAWIESQRGRVGIGSSWRPTPDPVSPASQAGHSFHQDQRFRSGFVGIAAVDAVCPVPGHVHRAPTWSEVPPQGSTWSTDCGIHANVSDEPWHLQPVELDGWQSWVNAGRPDPTTTAPPPPKPPPPPTLDVTAIAAASFDDQETDPMFITRTETGNFYLGNGVAYRQVLAGKNGELDYIIGKYRGRLVDFRSGAAVKTQSDVTPVNASSVGYLGVRIGRNASTDPA